MLLVFFPQFVFAEGLTDTLSKFFRIFIGWILQGSRFFVIIGQFLFMIVIEHTILEFGKSWKDGLLSGFGVAWQVLRDLMNLVIVVMFVLTAMITAFGDGRFGVHRKSLISLIGAAIFCKLQRVFHTSYY